MDYMLKDFAPAELSRVHEDEDEDEEEEPPMDLHPREKKYM